MCVQALQAEVSKHQSDLDKLSDAAQDLVRVSADSRVMSQASQLSTKHQSATINIKVGSGRGEQGEKECERESDRKREKWKKKERDSDRQKDRQREEE